jgi:hypothetical protein
MKSLVMFLKHSASLKQLNTLLLTQVKFALLNGKKAQQH